MTTKKCYELGANSPFRVASKRVSEWQSSEGERKRQALTFFPHTLFLHLLFVPFAHDFSWYPLNGELAHRLLRFSLF